MPATKHPYFTRRPSIVAFAVILLLAVLLSTLAPLPARAQSAPIVYEHLNTELTLDEQGMLHVRIIQQIRFNGRYSGAFYEIPLENVTSIANVQLYAAATEADNYELDTVDLVPLNPNFIEDNGAEVLVDWNYPETRPGDVRLFVIEFDAYGVVWVYPDQDFISWKAVGEDRSGVTVEESEVTLTLPDIMPMEQVTATHSAGNNAISVTGNTITFETDEPVVDGDTYVVEAYFPHGILDVGVREWQRIYDGDQLRVEVDRFHADVTIQADGTLSVQEQTGLTVLQGALHQGVRSIRLLYVDEITEPTVAANGQPLAAGSGDCTGCFEVNTLGQGRNWVYLDPRTEQLTIDEDNTGLYNIDWYTPLPIQAGERLTTTITYQVHGALRVNEQDQLLTWQVVPDFDQPVREASLRLTLPPSVSPEQIVMDAPDEQGSPQLQQDGSLLYHFDGPVVPGAWQIALTLPGRATSAQPPGWQEQFEETMAEADAAAVARARNTLIQRVLGALAIVGAIIAGIFAWMRWGRRKVKETLGGYTSEPPSQQSPAMVSYLVERKASERGVLGDIFFLATLGLLEIDLEGEIKLRRVRNEALQGTPRLDDAYGKTTPIPRHLQALFDQVLLPGLPHNQWAPLDSIATRLRAGLPEIYALLAADLQKFFIRVPGSGGDTIPGTLWFFVYATLLALMFFEIIPWWLGFIGGFLALLIFVGWSAMRETGQGGYSDVGALEADRWRRFKTYLQEIKKYGDQGAAQEILDRYFGYAVALGVEDVLLAQAGQLGSQRPVWMPSPDTLGRPEREQPRPRPSTGNTSTDTFPWTRPSTPRPAPSQPPQQLPTLAGMSERLGSSIRQASRDLGSLLATAAGDPNSATRSVTVNSQLRRREMEWKPNTPVSSVLDDILRQSVSDAREIQAREVARRNAERSQASRESSSWGGGGGRRGGSGWGGGSSRSSSSFGSSSRSSGSFSRSSSSRSSSSSSSRSSGGGRSGFR